MRAVIQRVSEASVDVGDLRIADLAGPGLLVLLGVTHTDSLADALRMAAKIHGLRIFTAPSDPAGASECSVGELGLPILVVSQFTLYASTNKGRRPTWDAAAPSAVAEPLVTAVVANLEQLGVRVQTGQFGADMAVRSINDGPMTIILDVP